MRPRIASVLVAAALAVACGSSTTTPTSPTPGLGLGPAPSPVPAPMVDSFTYDADVSPSDRQLIESASVISRTFFERQVGRALAMGITFIIKSSGGLANAGNMRVNLSIVDPSGRRVGGAAMTKIVGHEMFHLVQQNSGWPSVSDWPLEGSAEFVGYAISASAGFTTYEDVKTCQLARYIDSPQISATPLEEVFPRQVDGRYGIAWLAWDHILNGEAGIPLLGRYLQGMSFEQSFGKDMPATLADFAEYRKTLRRPPGGACITRDGTSL